MTSIRRRLILWLLPGFLVLWIAGGTTVYLVFRASEIARIDEELEDAQRSVWLTLIAGDESTSDNQRLGARRRRASMPQFTEVGSGYYYEIYSVEGELEQQSPSLEGRTLPSPLPEGMGTPRTVILEGGEVVRILMSRTGGSGSSGGRRGRGPGRGTPKVTAVAINLEGVHSSLNRLITGMIVTGAVGAMAGALLVGLALRDGLQPLLKLGSTVARIDSQSLSTRFSSGAVPREIEPVVHRLNELLDRLEQGFDRERRFSSDLAHELRTPLAELRSLVEMGLRWPDEINKDQQQEILQTGLHMQRMVEAMLLLARCETSPAPSDEESPLEALLEECWQPCASLARDRGIELVVNVASSAVIRGSLDFWSPLLGNLLSNAAEYAPEKTTVSITSGQGSLIEITNSAPQLKPDDLSKMFDRLWRADRARTGEAHSGLGLSIAQACANALGLVVEASLDDQNLLVMRISEPARR